MAKIKAGLNGESDGRMTLVISLLKEYTEKLNRLAEEKIRGADHRRLDPVLTRIQGPAANLARMASQQIEYGISDDVARLEIMLRLAEFEGALEGLRNS